MARRSASQSYSERRTIDVAWRYYGGAGTGYVAEQLDKILSLAAADPTAALQRLLAFLATIPANIAERAIKAMMQVKIPDEVIEEMEFQKMQGADEVQLRQIIASQQAWWQVLIGLLAISDWLHDALFIKTQYMTEAPAP